jgi:hypothetical protein
MIDRSNSQQVMLLHYRCACFLLAPATWWKSNKYCAITHANPKKVTQTQNINISWQVQLFKWCHKIISKRRITREEYNTWRDFREIHANKTSKLRLIRIIFRPRWTKVPISWATTDLCLRISRIGKCWLHFCHCLSRRSGGCYGLFSGVSWTPAASP